eukprot:1155000-Pelagomonas_calceolata.AAC.5
MMRASATRGVKMQKCADIELYWQTSKTLNTLGREGSPAGLHFSTTALPLVLTLHHFLVAKLELQQLLADLQAAAVPRINIINCNNGALKSAGWMSD